MLHMMNTKILLHIKVILFVVLQCVFMSAVKGQDVACKVGEYPPYGFTSGLASQCSGISKITTEAECKMQPQETILHILMYSILLAIHINIWYSN